MKITDIIKQTIEKNAPKCPKCGKPVDGILKAKGPFKGRGDFTHGGARFAPAGMQTREEAGLCSCQQEGRKE